MILNGKQTATRTNSGSLATLAVAVVLIFLVGIGAFAIDISHNTSTRTALQNATDAGAIAGAEDFKSASTYNLADTDALTVAATNSADGRQVANTSAGTTVTTTSQPPSGDTPGTCQVTASMQINNMFAKLFGHDTDTITVSSTADYWTTVNAIAANQMFPIAPSLDDTSHGAALNTYGIGQSYSIYIEPSGGNAAWTSGTAAHPSTTVIRAAVDAALGLSQPPAPGDDPPVVADGSNQIALTQGLHNGVDLSGSTYASTMESLPYVVMPVITGSNPYVHSRAVVGFIAMKVTDVRNAAGTLIVTGNLVTAVVRGTGGVLPNAGSADPNNNLANLSVSTVKLVQ